MSIDMTLHELLNIVNFDKVFSDILCHMPEVVNKRALFMSAFNTLRLTTPAKESDVVIEVQEQDYLGDGVHDLWVNAACVLDSSLWENILAGHIRLDSVINKPDTSCKITNEMIVADLLWQLISYGFPEKSAALSGFILNNRRWPNSNQNERIEEICSYIDVRQVSGISYEDIFQLRNAENIAWISNITSYSLPLEKASYDMICFLDDFMWLNNETKTIVMISASDGYENEVGKIEEFANGMLKNPRIVYGKALLPGINMMVVFIKEKK